MAEEFVATTAKRLAVPLLISMSGTSGSGKTFSSLLLAAGLAGTTGKVGMVDAENGRGTLYADDPLIRAAMPQGYLYVPITPPYTPKRYTAALEALERAGCTVAMVDSTSHEWEGEGGCCDMAENNKKGNMPNWAMAKLAHKKFLAFCLSTRMDLIFCLRAREKVKITPDNKVVPMGIQPIAEKNFVFEMLLSLLFDEATHQYTALKRPKMLDGMFPGGELITKAHGERLRQWGQTGAAVSPEDLTRKRARGIAEQGTAAYTKYAGGLTAAEKRAIGKDGHTENLRIAAEADKAIAAAESDAPATESAGELDLIREHVGSDRFYKALGIVGWGHVDELTEIPADQRSKVAEGLRKELKIDGTTA